MTNPIAALLSGLPGAVLVTLVAFLLCVVTGWISSIIAGFRSERGRGLRFLLIFPLTNPIALLILLFRDRRAVVLPVGFYLLAAFSLPLGGAAAEWIENRRLHSYEKTSAAAGESLAVETLIPERVAPDDNIWEHPFLKPLATAGQHGPEGAEARETMSYKAMSVPANINDVRYLIDGKDEGKEPERPHRDPFRTLHGYALSTDQASAKLEDGYAPASWEECGRLILEHYEPATADFAALEEALTRPHDQYPYAWQDAFNMLLPHLSPAKVLTQSATCRSMAWVTQHQSAESFRDAQTAFELIHLGDSDLLISRLVQWAQTWITLNALQVAQQYHAWDDTQWSEIQARLSELDFPGQVPSSMRAERILGHATLRPIFEKRATDIIRTLDDLGTMVSPSELEQLGLQRGVKAVVDFFVSGLARAALVRQWQLALEAYEEFINAVELARDRSRTEAWKDLEVAGFSENIESYGILARMLLPALGKAFEKSIDAQTSVRLAIVACALERYYLAHGRYPGSLSELTPGFLPESPADPMTGQPWRYDRPGDRSFHLYSVGRNGIDDEGLYTRRGRVQGEPYKDDYAWAISEDLPPLPIFEVEPKPTVEVGDDRYNRQMMERYGLVPTEPTGDSATQESSAPEQP